MQKLHDSATPSLARLFEQVGGITGAFSSKIGDYVASRPDYPPALFDALRRSATIFQGAAIADIGAGTGLFTSALLQRGYNVVAVEPNAAMLSIADRLLLQFTGYRSVAASAESTSLTDASLDAITCAQAFHWFDASAVKREWLRILKPEGRVVLIWNTRPLDDPLQAGFDEILCRFAGEKHAVLTARQQFDTVPPFFGDAGYQQLQFANSQRLDRRGLASLVLSRSTMPDRSTTAGKAAGIAASDLFDRYAVDEMVTVNYVTVAFVGKPAA